MPASALVRRVFVGLLVANLAVVGVKLWVGFDSGSLAILGGAVDSCVDALNNVLALIVLTLGVNVLITWYEHRSGTELGSELLVADAAHTRADVFVTVGVVVSVLLMRQGWWWADSAVAIVVALVIVLVAYRILARTVPVLVDERAIPTRDIQDAAQAVPGVKSAYSIRSRGPSDLRYAEVTVCVDRHADVESAHAIADQVEERLKRDLRLHEVTVHVEPC